MNLYLAKINYNGELDFRLVKANNKMEAEDKIRNLYYNYVHIEITDIIE